MIVYVFDYSVLVQANPFSELLKLLHSIKDVNCFIVASSRYSYVEIAAYLNDYTSYRGNILIAPMSFEDVKSTAAWKANICKSLQAKLFITRNIIAAETARVIGVFTVLFL